MWNVVEQCMASSTHAWSMGSFGAIGEFMWDDGESCQPFDDHRLGCVTPRGGLAVVPRADIRPVAYEYLSKDPRDWVHGIAVCLPADNAQMANRDVVTELGPDTGHSKQSIASIFCLIWACSRDVWILPSVPMIRL